MSRMKLAALEDEKVDYDGASRITGLPKRVLYKRVRSNQIPHYKLSKHSTVFSVRELEIWLESLRAGRLRAQRRGPSVDVKREVTQELLAAKRRLTSPTAITPLEPSRERKKPMPPIMPKSSDLLSKSNEDWLVTNTEGQLECSCEDCQWAGAESTRLRSSVSSSAPLSVKPKTMSSREARRAYLTSVARVLASAQALSAQLLAIVCPLCGESCGGACVTGARTTGARDAGVAGKTSMTT